MSSSPLRAPHPDRPIPLPADVRLPKRPPAERYALVRPNDPEVPVVIMVPVTAAELADRPDLLDVLKRAGAPLPAPAPCGAAQSPRSSGPPRPAAPRRLAIVR